MAIRIGDNRANQNQPVGAEPTNTRSRVGTGFTNIQRYLRPSSGEQLGSKIQSGVGQQIGEAKSSFGQTAQQVGQQIQQGRLQPVSSYQSLLGKAASGKDISEEEAKTFQTGLKGQYSGLGEEGVQSSYAPVIQKAEALQRLGQQTRTEEGRKGLLQQFAAQKPLQYTSGKQKLDALLLGKRGQAQLAETLGQTSPLLSQATEAKQKALQDVIQARQQAQDVGSLLGQELASSKAAISAAAQQAAEKTRQQELAKTADLREMQRLANEGRTEEAYALARIKNYLTDDQLKLIQQFGPKKKESFLQGLNLREGTYDPRAFLTQEQEASSRALAKLAGTPDDYLRRADRIAAEGSLTMDPVLQQAQQKAARAEEIKNRLRFLYGRAGREYNFQPRVTQQDVDAIAAKQAQIEKQQWEQGGVAFAPTAQTVAERAALREELGSFYDY